MNKADELRSIVNGLEDLCVRFQMIDLNDMGNIDKVGALHSLERFAQIMQIQVKNK